MKSKKIAIIVCVFGILLIVGGLSLGSYIYLMRQSKEHKKVEDKILTEYNTFKDNVESFNEFRNKSYYNKVATDLYVESVESDYESWIEVIDDYTKYVDHVEEASAYLKENCVNKYYSNSNIKNKCDSFVIAYETTLNYYTKDIISFNEIITSYLRNLEEEQDKIKLYDQKYDYMDINLDGKFIGKD